MIAVVLGAALLTGIGGETTEAGSDAEFTGAGRGKIVLPGFVDPHNHLWQSLSAAARPTRNSSADSANASAQ
ncbi:hypothetical protein [Amycolatopsis sp. WAC 01375]|uniref:hypothetical protein n=1 Tax=Amycolatopsis sp. WAC 01375 TaxID=2203194 RepID=UPI001F2217F8|nr:hypothetical protein [Amycolatopsis sp. WAC 01375]